jgi:hypothetical protein
MVLKSAKQYNLFFSIFVLIYIFLAFGITCQVQALDNFNEFLLDNMDSGIGIVVYEFTSQTITAFFGYSFVLILFLLINYLVSTFSMKLSKSKEEHPNFRRMILKMGIYSYLFYFISYVIVSIIYLA